MIGWAAQRVQRTDIELPDRRSSSTPATISTRSSTRSWPASSRKARPAMFHVGVDPEVGAVICDPTPEQEEAMDAVDSRDRRRRVQRRTFRTRSRLDRSVRWRGTSREGRRTMTSAPPSVVELAATSPSATARSWPATVSISRSPGRDPRRARRERRRQVDADEDPHRARPARRGRDAARRRCRASHRRPAGRGRSRHRHGAPALQPRRTAHGVGERGARRATPGSTARRARRPVRDDRRALRPRRRSRRAGRRSDRRATPTSRDHQVPPARARGSSCSTSRHRC